MLLPMKDRLHVWHTGIAGTSPEAWGPARAPMLRASLTAMSNDKALAANASGRYEGMATHQARTEYSTAVKVSALLVDAMTNDQYLVLGIRPAAKKNAQGTPDHLILMLQAVEPKYTDVT